MSTRIIATALTCALAAIAQADAPLRSSATQRAQQFARLPNWTGFWETELSAAIVSGEFDPQAGPAAAADADPVLTAFMSRSKLAGKPPYNAEWQRRIQFELEALKRKPPAQVGPPAALKICTEGFPAAMESPVPDGMFQALVTPEETVFLFPSGEVRHIFTDGRGHPRKEDLWLTAMGDSIGHWEGDTLVIHTIARKAGPIGPVAAPGATVLSDRTEFSERVRRIDPDTMQNDMTIFDPLRFARPWTMSIRYVRVKDVDRMIPIDCTENDRNQVVNGHMTIVPPHRAGSPTTDRGS